MILKKQTFLLIQYQKKLRSLILTLLKNGLKTFFILNIMALGDTVVLNGMHIINTLQMECVPGPLV
jgi:hypothetical protein